MRLLCASAAASTKLKNRDFKVIHAGTVSICPEVNPKIKLRLRVLGVVVRVYAFWIPIFDALSSGSAEVSGIGVSN